MVNSKKVTDIPWTTYKKSGNFQVFQDNGQCKKVTCMWCCKVSKTMMKHCLEKKRKKSLLTFELASR